MKKKLLTVMAIIIFCIPVITESTPVIERQSNTVGDTLAVFISGDGGWREIDQKVTEYFNSHGVSVVGVNSLVYFLRKRTPDEAAEYISSLIDNYKAKYSKRRVMIIGYSFGADIVPFVVNRLQSRRSDISAAVMLEIEAYTPFEVTYSEWMGHTQGSYATMPEIAGIKNIPMLFVGGSDDKGTIANTLDRKKYDVIIINGGHHFDENYYNLAKIILEWYYTKGKR